MRIGTAVVLDEPEVFDEVSPEDLETVKQVVQPKNNKVEKKFFGLPPKAKAEECLPTVDFPHMEFPFEYFNPVQTEFLKKGIDSNNNVVVSSATSSGKTVIAETVIAQTLKKIRLSHPMAKAVYISPLRALCSEKYQTWSSKHSFAEYSISILTGDYVLTKEKKEELLKADIILMSSEMLGSRIRRESSEHNVWLTRDTRVLVIDECHLLTTERGPAQEVSLMKFSKVNPTCRLIGLSATMPNVEEIGKWFTHLNAKESIVIKSPYRPVDLDIHYELYPDGGRYQKTEEIKQDRAVGLINQYPKDKFIIFVHTKKTGYAIYEKLRRQGIICEFHNADVTREQRERIEREFRSKETGSLRVLIATSTISYGINTPARRVIITGITRGMNKVEPLDISQECGRSGRIGLDIKGDAHILINNEKAVEEIAHCKKIENITSKLGERKVFAFHLISEIAEKNISTIEEAVKWYLRSLLHFQSIFESEERAKTFIIGTFEELEKYGAIKKTADGYEATKLGLVASWYYLSPYDVFGWAQNFKNIMSYDFRTEDIAWALANVDTNLNEYEIKINEPQYFKFESYLVDKNKPLMGGVGKKAFAYYCLLKNIETDQREMYSIIAGTRMDMERVSSAIKTLGNISKTFEDCPNKHLVLELPYRLRYGTDNVELVLIPGVGSVTAKKIMGRRIFTCKELLIAQEMGQKVLTDEKWHKVREVVKQIANIGYLNYLKYEDKKAN